VRDDRFFEWVEYMNWFDSHCHLKGFKNKGNLEEILRRAEENGVSRMTAVGTSNDDWEIYKNLSEQYRDKIFYSVGLHPCYVNEGYENVIEKIESYLGSGSPPVALGEIGLDYFHLPKNHNEALSIIKNQKMLFWNNSKLLPSIICQRLFILEMRLVIVLQLLNNPDSPGRRFYFIVSQKEWRK